MNFCLMLMVVKYQNKSPYFPPPKMVHFKFTGSPGKVILHSPSETTIEINILTKARILKGFQISKIIGKWLNLERLTRIVCKS